MTSSILKTIASLLLCTSLQAELIFHDSFDRQDGSATEDAIGNGWSTNSAWRADGDKQVFLEDGVMRITRLKKANHAVSVKRDFPLGDCTVSMKFKISTGDRLGVNFNDPELKTAHAGHVCTVRITTDYVEVADQMNGSMNLVLRDQRKADPDNNAVKQAIAKTEKRNSIRLKPDSWHELRFEIRGDSTKVYINSMFVLNHESPGFAHPTKGNIALSVPAQVIVDDFRVWNQAGKK